MTWTRRDNYLLIGILLIGALLRAWYLADFSRGPDFASPGVDAEFHDYWARAIVTGDWTPPHGSEDPLVHSTPYLRPPGYPYFLAGVYRIFGMGYFAPRVVQMLLGLGSAVLAFLIGRRWFGRGVGAVAALLMSVYWAFIYFEAEFHAPVLMIFVTLLFMYTLGRWGERPSPSGAILPGLLLGLAALILPNVLLFGPFAALWMIIQLRHSDRGMRPSRIVACLTVFACATCVAIAPATIRNYRVSGEFVPITTNAGVNLYIGNHPGAEGLCLVEIGGLGKFETCFDYPALVRNLEAAQGRRLTHKEVDAFFQQKAMEHIRSNPGEFARLTFKKALMFWGPSEISHNKEVALEREHYAALHAVPISFGMVAAGAIVGLCWTFAATRHNRADTIRTSGRESGRHRRPSTDAASSRSNVLPNPLASRLALLMALYVAAFFLSILPFFNSARYRVPIIPFLMFFSAVAICFAFDAVRRRQWRAFGTIAGAGAIAGMIMLFWPYRFEADRSNWHYTRGVCHMRTGRPEAAMREYEAAIEIDPDNAKAHFNLGVLYQQAGRVEDAASQFARVEASGSYESESRRARISVLMQAGRLEEAADEIKVMLRDKPDDAQAHMALAMVRESQGRIDEAVSNYLSAAKLEPSNADVQFNLAAALWSAGRLEDAVAAYRQALVVRPTFIEARNNLAAALVQLDRLDEAEAEFRAVLKTNPDSRDAHLNLALVLTRQERLTDVVAHLSRWLERHPDDAEAHLRIGDALAAVNQREEAAKHYEAVLRAFPGNEAAARRLAELRDSP